MADDNKFTWKPEDVIVREASEEEQAAVEKALQEAQKRLEAGTKGGD